VAEVAERAANVRVAPARAIGRELNDQALERHHGRRATSTASSTAVVLLGDELAVPAQGRVGRDDALELISTARASALDIGST
jgi:hypothetical protein